MPRKKAVEEIYQKKSPREHVLLRPDTYVGSVERDTEKMYVMDEDVGRMVEREVEFVPALYKIFDEILVNAADNKQRDPSMKQIRIKIDVDRGCITIKNDGRGIPVEMHKEHGMYIPELIFGNLLTSSNYNDADLKTVGGRNGFGAKLANIFSTKFIVETVDSEKGLKYVQEWRQNMADKDDPDISEASSRLADYTQITFYPDFHRFGMESLRNEKIISLFIKRVYDVAGTTASDLSVYLYIKGEGWEHRKALNGKLPVHDFVGYSRLFLEEGAKKSSTFWAFGNKETDRWEVVLALSPDNEYRQISHVNNIWTIKGGTHVRYIENQFVKYFKDNFKSKSKKMKEMLKPKMIKDHLVVFINALIVNPAFSSQTKEVLVTKSQAFGSKCVVPEASMKSLSNKIKAKIKELITFKMEQSASKTDGKRKTRLNLPPEIDDANDAGSRFSADCTLIVTEGLSAKTLAVAGVTELPGSKNRFGIFPLRGKLLNVREANTAQILKNKEITQLKQVLGLRSTCKYETAKDAKTLRYGKIMIMTDQDTDGSHIKGLVINLFHSMWPNLVRKKIFGPAFNESFLEQFITPIVVVSKGRQKKAFYTVPKYEQWKREHNNGKGWRTKYYKGLGTWQRKEGKEHFRKLDAHRIAFKYTQRQALSMDTGREIGNENDLAIVKAFAKTEADARKEWIAGCEEGTFLDFEAMGDSLGRNKRVSYKDFIDRELILFSSYDLKRSVPALFDGLKPGQRKILYCCFLKNNLSKEIRVAQLGGYVSEKSAYHHGETSLYMTIIGMAQNYVGSNNINLLCPNGMFGSRIRGGKDAASPRYIHTKLAPITRRLFIPSDDQILEYQDDDGYPVEPIHYAPIIPLVLVNGALGIGTGWSTAIPNFNPSDIMKNIRRKLVGDDWVSMRPFYRGFTGKIEECKSEEGRCRAYKSRGNVEVINSYTDSDGNEWSTIQVTELPVGLWTEVFKKLLLDFEETEQIEGVNNMSSDIDVSFTFNIMHRARPAKGKGARSKKGNATDSLTGSTSHSGSTSPVSGAKTKKLIRKKLYFSGRLDEDFLKDIKCVSPISLTNMVLFDTSGKIRRFDSVQDILDEFYGARLGMYSARKKAMLLSMEHNLKKIANQARFVLMVIDGEMKVSNRRRLDVVKDLRDKGFDTWTAGKGQFSLKKRAASTEDSDAEGEGDSDATKKATKGTAKMDADSDSERDLKALAGGYKYLLSMPISSLTKEKVADLLKLQEETEHEVESLQRKSAKDLWRADLDRLEEHLEEYRAEYEEEVERMREEAERKRKGMKATTKGKKKRAAPKKRAAATKKKTVKNESKSGSRESSTSSIKRELKKLSTKPAPAKKAKAAPKATASKKRKLLGNKKGTNPFALAASKRKVVDSDDSSSYSESPGLSLMERARMRASPEKQNMRKRKRPGDDSDSEWEMESKPPIRKRKVVAASPESSSESSMPLKARSSKLNVAAKRKKLEISESEDDDIDSEDGWAAAKGFGDSNKRTLRKKKKTVSYKEESNGARDDESDYQMSDDLEIDEFDESDGDSEYIP